MHEQFHYHSLEDLRNDIAATGVNLEASEDVSALTQPAIVGAFTLPNRFVVLPMEGCDGLADGSPDELTYRRYRRFAGGGSGMVFQELRAL